MDKIAKSLENTIKESELQKIGQIGTELLPELEEIIVDQFIYNGPGKEIPIVKTIFAIKQTATSISSFLLSKKILSFLYELRDIPIIKRRKFVQELEGKNQKNIFEHLILILDKHDHLKKSVVVGKLFGAYIKEEITGEDFNALIYAINMMDVDTLPILHNFYHKQESTSFTAESLYNFAFLRLIQIDDSTVGKYNSKGLLFQKNHLGELLVKYTHNI